MTISSETLHIFICFIVKIGYTKGEQTFYFVPWRLVIMTTYTFFLNILFTFQNLKIRCWGVLLHFSRLQRACILYNVYTYSIFKFISSSFNKKKTQGWEFAHRFSKRSSCFFFEKISEWAIRSKKQAIRCEQPERFAHIAHQKRGNRSFAHFLWATWANCSRSLIRHAQPERFAHGCSFVLSNLSESLTVAHVIWAKWANKRWAKERIPSPEKLRGEIHICAA